MVKVMRSRFFVFAIGVIFVVLLIWQQFLIVGIRRNNEILQGHLQDNSDLENNINLLSEDIINIMEYQGKVLDAIWIYNQDSDSLLLNTYDNKPVFFLCINQNGCADCIDKSIDMVDRLSERVDVSQLAILGKYSNPIYFYKYKKVNDIDVPMFHFRALGIKNENSTTPFGFILHNGVIQKFFIFHKEFRILNSENEIYIWNYLMNNK